VQGAGGVGLHGDGLRERAEMSFFPSIGRMSH